MTKLKQIWVERAGGDIVLRILETLYEDVIYFLDVEEFRHLPWSVYEVEGVLEELVFNGLVEAGHGGWRLTRAGVSHTQNALKFP